MLAVDDNELDSGETIVATLSGPTVTEGSATLGTASDSVTITDIDQSISFSIAADADSISEETGPSATFTISLTGFPLNAGNTATVNIAASGTATGGTDYTPALLAALQTVADATDGVTLVGIHADLDSSFVGSTLAFTVAAVDDNELDSGETIVATLSGPTVTEGSATLGTASDSVTITEIDQSISFSIAADVDSISEETGPSATFTISLTGFPLNAGNTATVNIAASGTATGGTDYTPALLAALQTVADATDGVTLVGTTLTFDSSFVGSTLAFTVAAVDDNELDSGETIVATLSGPTVTEGSATLGTASDSVTITDIDQSISFSIAAMWTPSARRPGHRRPSRSA